MLGFGPTSRFTLSEANGFSRAAICRGSREPWPDIAYSRETFSLASIVVDGYEAMLSREEVELYRLDGYLPGRPLLSPAEAERFRNDCLRTCAKPIELGDQNPYSLKRHASNRVKPYLLFPWAAELVRQLAGGAVDIATMEVARDAANARPGFARSGRTHEASRSTAPGPWPAME